MIFAAMLAFSMAQISVKLRTRVRHRVLYHITKAMERLRDQLSGLDHTSDVVIMTIVMIAFTNLWMHDVRAFNVHVEAAKKIVELRAGEDHLGMVGYVKSRWRLMETTYLGSKTAHVHEFGRTAQPSCIRNIRSQLICARRFRLYQKAFASWFLGRS